MPAPVIGGPIAPRPAAVTTPAAPAAPASPAPARPDRFEAAPAARPVDVLFTPEEDAYGYEAQCIAEVIAARQADTAVYPPGHNPYRVEYMVFNLRNQEVTSKLFEAAKAGVQVQVLVEADQIKDERPWNKLASRFEEQGLKVLRSDKGTDAATRAAAHLVGIDKSSLMHMKARIFHFKDPHTGEARAKVLSGSLNPGGAPVLNDENLNVITDARIVDKYARRFLEVRDQKQAKNEWDDSAPINVLFTPHTTGTATPTRKLFEWIDAENELILISVFQLHDLQLRGEASTLISKLKDAQARGATVMALTDRRKSDGVDDLGQPIMMYNRPAHDDPTDEAMQAAGIPVIEVVNTSSEFSAVHGKSVLFGLTGMKVMTDAGNWTVAAMGSDKADPRNEESFLFVDSGKLDGNATGRAYLGNFLGLLRKYDSQTPEDAEAIISRLQRLPGWPKVNVDLGPVARAHPGKEVFLVCNHPDIMARVPAGSPGLPISSAPATPPFRPADPVKLPLGTRLEFRVAVRDPATGAVHTDPGDSVLLVEPARHGK